MSGMNAICRPIEAVRLAALGSMLFAPAVTGANAGPIAFHEKASTIGLLTYEVVVVLVEWVLLRWLFRLPWARALLFALGANCVSFLVGIPFSLAVPLAVFWVFPMLPSMSSRKACFGVWTGQRRNAPGFGDGFSPSIC